MLRAIGYKKVDISDEEFKYYQELVEQYTTEKIKGADYFAELFEVDGAGRITIIKPKSGVPWSIIFWAQQVMISGQLRGFEEKIEKIESIYKK